MKYFQTFITAVNLQEILAEERVIIFDCSFDFLNTDKMYDHFKEIHIPGAYYAHVDNDLSGVKTSTTGAHPLPSKQAIKQFLVQHGVRTDSQIIVYDNFKGAIAARLWWLCKWIGIDNVAILQGGIKYWQQLNFSVNNDIKPQKTGELLLTESLVSLVGVNSVEQAVQLSSMQLIDSREEPRYTGEYEPFYKKAGHIPTASNRFFLHSFDENGLILNDLQLKEDYTNLFKKPTSQCIFYCGSGITACLHIAVLAYIGIKDVKLFAGSWSEWIADPNRPIAVGLKN